jgi:hypothetical protein
MPVASSNVTFPCPRCGGILKMLPSLDGTTVTCPLCNNPFTMPTTAIGPTPPPSPLVNTPRPPRQSGLRTANQFHSPIRRYLRWAGTRSFVFQSILAGWTAFMLCAGLGIFAVYLMDARLQSQWEGDRQAVAMGFMLLGVCCPMGIYLLLAIPLGIAAIASLECNSDQ